MTSERSRGSVLPRAFADVISDFADLVLKEVRLAKAELSAKLSNKLRAGMWMSTAAGLALIAVILLAQALVLWIAAAFGISIHLSCLIVAVGVAAASRVVTRPFEGGISVVFVNTKYNRRPAMTAHVLAAA